MSEREKIVSGIEAEGLVAIVRVPRPELTLPLAKALVAGGIRAVELTMSIRNALFLDLSLVLLRNVCVGGITG